MGHQRDTLVAQGWLPHCHILPGAVSLKSFLLPSVLCQISLCLVLLAGAIWNSSLCSENGTDFLVLVRISVPSVPCLQTRVQHGSTAEQTREQPNKDGLDVGWTPLGDPVYPHFYVLMAQA